MYLFILTLLLMLHQNFEASLSPKAQAISASLVPSAVAAADDGLTTKHRDSIFTEDPKQLLDSDSSTSNVSPKSLAAFKPISPDSKTAQASHDDGKDQKTDSKKSIPQRMARVQALLESSKIGRSRTNSYDYNFPAENHSGLTTTMTPISTASQDLGPMQQPDRRLSLAASCQALQRAQVAHKELQKKISLSGNQPSAAHNESQKRVSLSESTSTNTLNSPSNSSSNSTIFSTDLTLVAKEGAMVLGVAGAAMVGTKLLSAATATPTRRGIDIAGAGQTTEAISRMVTVGAISAGVYGAYRVIIAGSEKDKELQLEKCMKIINDVKLDLSTDIGKTKVSIDEMFAEHQQRESVTITALLESIEHIHKVIQDLPATLENIQEILEEYSEAISELEKMITELKTKKDTPSSPGNIATAVTTNHTVCGSPVTPHLVRVASKLKDMGKNIDTLAGEAKALESDKNKVEDAQKKQEEGGKKLTDGKIVVELEQRPKEGCSCCSIQ